MFIVEGFIKIIHVIKPKPFEITLFNNYFFDQSFT